MYFWSLINFVQNDFPQKMSFSALKKHFLTKLQLQLQLHFDVKKLFIPMVFCYLNPEGQLKAT